MTWRSEAMLTARDPSTTRCTSSSPISRSARATATTPVEFCDQRCVPPSETTTSSMRWPAMRSADTAASWMAAMVLSRLTTTPLRRPSHLLSPTPTTLTGPPPSSESAMITATRLVPRSRPTVFFRRDKGCCDASWNVGWIVGRVAGIIRASGRYGPDFVGGQSGETRRCVWVIEELSQIVTADGAEIVEDSHPKSHYRRDAEIDAELVAEEGQAGGQGHVGHQATEEDARLERPRDVSLEGPEDRVQRRQQADGRVPRVGDRNRDRRKDSEQRAEKREQDRDDDYLHGGVGAGVGFAPGDGLGGVGSLEWNPAAGSDAFIRLT